MDIEKYGFERTDLLVATAANAYLKKLTPEARRETLAAIVKKDGIDTTIDGERLAALNANAKDAAMISFEEWQPGEGDCQKALTYIQEHLPDVDGKKYVTGMPKKFLQFIEDCVK